MKALYIFVSLFFLTLFYSCQDDLNFNNNSDESLSLKSISLNSKCVKDGVKIAILSDIHVMDPSLLMKDGPAFQAYLAQDPKLLELSLKILQATVNKIIAQKPDLVLIPGDLTKDGEIISHITVSNVLRQLTKHGIKVLVTMGNHDVNNPESVLYFKSTTFPYPSIQADRIPFIYSNFGFNNAISRDPNSLSYVNEPIKDLWVITIDANKYYQNTTKSIVGGVIKPETMRWVKEQLAIALSKGKTVIGMMHHGLIEHFNGQEQIDPGYVVDDSESSAEELMNAGMKIILTGHYHANDITKKEYNGKFIFDVETGSTVAYPCTYRMLTITGNKYSFESQNTTNLMGPGFDLYAKTFLSEHLDGYFTYLLTNLYSVPANYAQTFAPYFKAAAMAHFAGDEVMPPDLIDQINYLNAVDKSGTLSMVLGTLWTDINTPDNNVTIDMETGVAQ
ncbi:MAG: metallophosphoesterase [Bacteroidota bacterium]|nr:metallophosphoesterase [Bacteroidota bacterium]